MIETGKFVKFESVIESWTHTISYAIDVQVRAKIGFGDLPNYLTGISV